MFMVENENEDMEISIRVNGEVLHSVHINSTIDIAGGTTSATSRFYTQSIGEHSNSFSYFSPEMHVNTYSLGGDTEWYSVQLNDFPNTSFRNHHGLFGNPPLTEEDRNSNMIRLFELSADLVVGNLRNNISISQQGDGVRRVTAAITQNQIPEIVNLLVDMGVEESYRNNRQRTFNNATGESEYIFSRLISSMTITRASGVADIDADGNIIYMNGIVNMSAIDTNGNPLTIDMEFSMDLYDFGTSVPQMHIPGVAEIFTRNFVETNFPNNPWHQRLFFQLDGNGNINESTITGIWPVG
jgi:hypothetical protein